MARIQILELPTVYDGDQGETPFVLVVDETSYPTAEAYQTAVAWWGKLSIGVGAKDCIVTDDTVDIPANVVSAPVDDAFKAEVQQWAVGTNETIARLVEAFSHRQKRPRRVDDNDVTGEPHLTFDDREVRATAAGDNEQYREQVRQGILYAQGKVTRAVDEQRLTVMDRLAKWKNEPHLLHGFCYEEQGEEVHPHPECPDGAGGKPSIEDVVRLEGVLHLLRFALDRFIRAGFKPAPEYLRDLLDKVTDNPGEPCDRDQQYARAEAAEAAVDRVRAESARIRSITPTWGPVADLIDAALDDPGRPREQRMRPTHADGTPYSYYEITAEGWGFCDGCRMWSTATPDRPHPCAETHTQGPIDGKEVGDV